MQKIRIALIIIVIVGFAGFHAFKALFAEKDMQKLDRIADTYLTGDFETAVNELTVYLKKYPKDDLAWTIKGNALEELNRDKKAEEAYLTAIKINSKNFQATNALGVLYRKSGDNKTAMSYYKKALELQPDYAQAYSSMAVIELMNYNDKEAMRLAEKAYKNDDEDSVIAANLAIVYHYSGDHKKRDKFTKIAKKLGYKNMSKMEKIYKGELTVRDPKPVPEKKIK